MFCHPSQVDRNSEAAAALPAVKQAVAPESNLSLYRSKILTWPAPAPLPPPNMLLKLRQDPPAQPAESGGPAPEPPLDDSASVGHCGGRRGHIVSPAGRCAHKLAHWAGV